MINKIENLPEIKTSISDAHAHERISFGKQEDDQRTNLAGSEDNTEKKDLILGKKIIHEKDINSKNQSEDINSCNFTSKSEPYERTCLGKQENLEEKKSIILDKKNVKEDKFSKTHLNYCICCIILILIICVSIIAFVFKKHVIISEE